MRTRKVFTEKDNREIINLYNSGENITVIADLMNTHRQTIQNKLKRLELEGFTVKWRNGREARRIQKIGYKEVLPAKLTPLYLKWVTGSNDRYYFPK